MERMVKHRNRLPSLSLEVSKALLHVALSALGWVTRGGSATGWAPGLGGLFQPQGSCEWDKLD